MSEPREAGIGPGEAGANIEAMFAEVAGELRAVAGKLFAGEGAGHTLQPTALINEAFMRLKKSSHASYADRDHFFRVAATTLRRILVEHARGKKRLIRGGDRRREHFGTVIDEAGKTPTTISLEPEEILAMHEALESLAAEDARLAKVVELRFFAGLSVEEVARVLGVTDRTVFNDWRFAKAKLVRLLRDQGVEWT